MKLADYLKLTDTSQAAFAEKLGVSQGLIHQWISGKRPVSAEQCPIIERITGGQVTCEELNDKVDWGFVRSSRDSPADRSARKGGKPKADAQESHPEAA